MPPKFDAYHTWLGIPPEDQPPNHYRLLGLVSFEGNPTVIENAADQRMIHLRTFQSGKHAAASQMLLNSVSAAKLCLLSPETKARYDEQLRRDLAATAGPPPANPVANLAAPQPPPPRVPQPPPPRTAPSTAPPTAPPPTRPMAPQAPPPQPPAGLSGIAEPTGTERGTAGGRSYGVGNPRGSPPVALIGGAVAGVVLLLVLIAWALTSGALTSGGAASGDTMLVVDWSGIQGEPVGLRIDSKPVHVSTSGGSTRLPCKPGKHHLIASRPGFQSYNEIVTLKPGESRRVVPVWARQSSLILMMSEEDRFGMQLEIDGTKRDVSRSAPEDTSPTHLRVPIDAGLHKVQIFRPGREPFEKRIRVVEGKEERVYPPSKPIATAITTPDLAQPNTAQLNTGQPAAGQPGTTVDAPGVATNEPTATTPKLPKPSPETIQALTAEVDRQYPPDQATTEASRLELCEKLAESAKREQGNADRRFVLLSRATVLASAANDRRRTFELIDGIADQFDVDPLRAKAEMLPGFAARATDSQKFRSFVFGAQQVLDEALAGQRGDLVVDAIQGKLEYRGPYEDSFHKQLDERLAAADQLATQWAQFHEVLATLDSDADNADANLVAGRWTCFREADWAKGLPLLAKGSDAELRSLAQKEHPNPPTEAQAQAELAEAWWKRAQAESDPIVKSALTRHAAQWFAEARAGTAALPLGEESFALKDRIQAGIATVENAAQSDLGRTALPPPEGENFPPGVWFDLLESVDVVRHATRGQWARQGDAIKTVEPFSRLALPATVEDAYDLQVDFTRFSGDDTVGIVFPVGATQSAMTQSTMTQTTMTQCSLILSGWHGAASGLQMIDGRNAQNQSTMPPVTLMNGRRYSALITVRPTLDLAEIDVRVDTDPPTTAHWKGPRSSLGATRDWSLASWKRPGLGATDANVIFHAVRVRMHDQTDASEADAIGTLVAQADSTAPVHEFTPYFGSETGVAFQDVGPEKSQVAGFRFVLSDRIEAIRAVYRTDEGLVDGRQFGKSGSPNHSVLAKDGYAVGQIVAPLAPTAEGMRIVFMRETDDHLDPSDRYESDWIGRPSSEPQRSLGRGSAPVVGIHGTYEANTLSALGLIVSGSPPSAEHSGRSKSVSLTELKPQTSQAADKGLAVNQAPIDSWPMVPEDPTSCDEYLPAQAPSSLIYEIPKNRKSFSAVAYCVATPSVRFGVVVDGQPLFKSDKGGVIPIRIDLPPGSKRLELLVDPLVDPLGNTRDGRSYWLLPRLHGMDASKIGQLDAKTKHDKLTQQTPLEVKAGIATIDPSKFRANVPLDGAAPIHLVEPQLCTEFLFAPAPSRLTYDVPPGMKRFSAVGYCVQAANVTFRVLADDTRPLFESETGRPAGIIDINVVLPRGCKNVTLVAEPAAADLPSRSFWCYPRFTQ